jgi:wobble nucleotide-excising tRNase
MITKINKIKDFGVFKNFNGSALPEFKTFNLIYGWNYSGKTTLSRVFRCFEKGKLHDDYLLATFELENATVKYDNTFAVKPNIRVFNSDFIKENLKWDAENIEPIFLLGAENIELQTELKQKEKDQTTAEVEFAEARRLRLEKQNRLNTALTNKAREITNLLSLGRTFDRDRLKQLVETVKDNVANYTLSQTDFDKYKAQAISNEQKPPIGEIIISIVDLTVLKTEVDTILQRQAASDNKIQKLLDSKPISDWVETGKSLHEGKTDCEFCGNTLPTDLLAKLNEHFSQDYELLKTDIEAKIKSLIASKINLNVPLPTETAFYSDLQPDFKKKKPLLETEINSFNTSIDSLIKDLETKRDKPFDRLDVTALTNNKTKLEAVLTNFNSVIIANDQRTAAFTTEKNAAIEKLKEHFAAEFETTETYSAIQIQLTNEQTEIDTKGVSIERQKQAVALIKTQLDETVKGAGKVNDYLRVFFGKDDIQINSTADKKFKLVRGTEVAKNLSEGEKTAIAFAYFTAKLEEQNNHIADTIVYIDDPISSLDSNHLFNIYSFIRNTFYEATKDANGGNLHVCKCKQLYVSTHNFEFYNLVYDWFSKTKKNQTPQGYYIVERTKNAHKDESTLIVSNSLIQKYKSEYVYLFSLVFSFYQTPTDTFENLYHLPNILRKFVETYLNFKFLSSVNIEESIDELITDPIKCERARKFMHYYSHSLTTDKFIKFADLAECTDVVKIVVESVKANDPTHYKSLIESVTFT